MKNILIRLFITFACTALLAMAVPRSAVSQVLIVQGSSMEVYQQAVSGFTQAFTPTTSLPGISSIHEVETLILDPDSQDNLQLITGKTQVLQPHLIVAVGSLALQSVVSHPGPVIYLMVPDPDSIVSPRPGLSGVRMTVLPAQQLKAIKKTFPKRTRIGLLHDPASSVDFLKDTQSAAKRAQLTLVSIPAASGREAIQSVIKRQDTIDALLLTPEPSLVSPIILDALAQFSLERKIPVIAFSPKYLEQGAALVVFTSPDAMGRQAAKLAREYLARSVSRGASPEYATEATVVTNSRIIRNMDTPFVSSISNEGRILP